MKIFTQTTVYFSSFSFSKVVAICSFLLLSTLSFGQNPTVLYTSLTTTTPSPTNSRFGLTTMSGVFKQARFQSNQTVSSGSAFWAFHQGSAGSPDYSNNWRPYTSGNLLSVNNYIPVGFANGARYNGGGGSDGQLPAITSGNYYTFNVTNNTSDNIMQLLETTYNPVTVSGVTQAAGTFGSRLVTITTSGTPNASENIYVRYSTNSYTSSTLVQATGSGTTWTATIPWQSSVVSFYVYTSNKTLSQINTDVTTNSSQTAHDMATLNLNNNGGSNYSWTPPTGSIIVTSTGGTLANTPTAYSTFTVAAGLFSVLNTGTAHTGAVTVLVTADITTETGATLLNASANWTSLGIQPKGIRTISGSSSSGAALINLNGADNVNINGLNDGSNSLTISSTTSSTTALTCTIRFQADATSNTIQNSTIKGVSGNTSSSANQGVIIFSTGTTTGNTGNIITNNTITAGTSLPVSLIYSLGSAGIPNTVTVTNNNFSDWGITAAANNAGIWLGSDNTGWTITGNKFFQSASRAGATSNSYAINILSGTGYTVSNNTIGYATSTGSGTFTVTAGTACKFTAIGLSLTAGGTATEVQGNTITAFNISTTASVSTGSGIFTGIYVTSGNVNIGTTTGNLIGNTSATNFIIVTSNTTGGLITGINTTSAGTVSIQNNNIASFSTGGTAAIGYSFIGISTAGAAAYTVSSNNIGSAVANSIAVGTSGTTTSGACSFTGINHLATGVATISSNIVQNVSVYGTTGVQAVYGINIPATYVSNSTVTISGNTIATINQAGTAATSFVYAIAYQGIGNSVANTVNITSNIINNITGANANVTVSSGAVGVIGIYFIPTTNATPWSTPIISDNTINTLSATNATAIGTNVVGIVATATGGTGLLNNNKIFDLRNASTGTTVTSPPTATGIYIRNISSGTLTTYNNMISLGSSQTSNTQFMGIWNGLTSTGIVKVYFNSISISGTASGGALPSFGFLRGDNSTTAVTSTVDIQNNIFSNSRTGGTGKHYAIANQGTLSTTGWAAGASNYNVLNSANSSTIALWGSTDKTFSAWQAAQTGGSGSDINSYSGITVTFSNVATGDLHLNMGATATALESSGNVISGITTDYDAQTRPGGGITNGGGFAPDLGADEFDGKGLLPTITSLGAASGCVGGQLVINGTNLQGAIAANVKIGGTPVTSVVSNTGTVLTVVVASGSGTVTVLNAGGTATSGTSYTVNPLPTTTWSATATSVCSSTGAQTTTLNYTATANSPTTYSITWSSVFATVTDAAFAGTPTGGQIIINVPAGAAAGTYTGTITVKTAGGCVSSGTQTFTVTINPLPTATWAASSSSVCFNAASSQNVTLAYSATSNTPTSYSITWSSVLSNITNQANTFTAANGAGTITIPVPANTSAGTYTGTITVKNANSCVSSATQTFTLTVNPLPTATAANGGPYCTGDTIQLTGGANGNSTYSWSGPNGYSSPIISQTISQNFDGLNTGTSWTDNSTLTGWYLLQGNGGATPTTAVTALLVGTGTVSTGSMYNFSNGVTTSDRALGSSAANAIATAGSPAFYYGVKITNTTGATATSLAITYTGEQYRDVTTTAQPITVDYSLNATALTTASGTWTPISALTFTTPTNNNGVVALDGNASANRVAGITTTLTGLSIPNNTSVWVRWTDTNDAGNDQALAIDDVSIVLSAPSQNPTILNATTAMGGTYTLTTTSSFGCSNTATTTVVVNPKPAITAMTNSACSGFSFTSTPVDITNGVVPSGTTYSWSAPSVTGGLTGGASGSAASSITGTLTNPTNTAQTATYTVTPTANDCSGTTFTVTVTVNPTPAITNMTNTACSGSGFTSTPVDTTNGVVPSGTTYSWSAPSVTGGLTGGASGSAASSITGTLTNPTSSPQTATYTVTPISSGCAGSTFTVIVTVNPTPAVTNMTNTACSGLGFTSTPVDITDGVVPSGTTYSWSAPSVTGGLTGGTSGSAASSITGTLTNPTTSSQTATYTVTPTASGCAGSTFTVTVTVNPTPAITNMTNTACSDSGFTSTPVDTTNGVVPSGTTYSWSAPSVTGGLTGGASGSAASSITGTLTNPTSSAQTATYTVTPTSGSCSGSTFTVTVTVNPKPAVTDMTNGTCSGVGFTSTPVDSINGVVPTGTTYSWLAPSVTGGLTGGASGSGASSISGTLTNPTSSPQTATYTVTPTSGSCQGSTFTVTVTVSNANTWTGADSTVWSLDTNWSCGLAPTSTTNVTIGTSTNDPIITSDVAINSLTINSGETLTVNSTFDLTVTDAIVNNGTLTMQNNSNLIQVNDVANTGSGSTVVNRNTASLIRLDYVLWSSPVSGQQLLAFSPLTLTNRFYTFDGTLGAAGQYVAETATNNFVTGKGFLIRMPYNHPTGPVGGVFNGVFTGGTAFNGTLNLTSLPSGKFYATGNPYPSTIDADQFISDNNIGDDPLTPGDGLYFWRKTNNSAAASYATYTTAGGVQSGGDSLNIVPNGVIQVGEGFIVKVPSTSLTFNNGQRIGDNSNQFLKTTTTIERHRIWLNLSDSVSNINQMMVAYMTGATQNIDATIDGRYINDNPTALNSLINNGEFAIQGRSLPFDSSDVVPLAFKASSPGSYTITLDHTDGLFTDVSQPIYVKDNVTDTYHDLNTGAYAFDTEAGTFIDRFQIVYALPLGVENPVLTANNVIVYSQNNEFVVKSGNIEMSSIMVFDIRGRLLVEKKGINATQTTIGSGLANEVLLVQITSVDGVVVTKKVVR